MQSTLSNSKPLVTLTFGKGVLNTYFPNDPAADFTIILSATRANYRVQKSFLVTHSDYFNQYFNDEKTEDFKITMVTLKFDPIVFDQMLKCFYGYPYAIYKDKDVYAAYQISAFLKIDLFVRLIEQAIIDDFQCFQFTLIYQLGELYQVDSIKSICLDYLESEPQVFRKILDLNQIQLQFIKTKQLLGQSKLIQCNSNHSSQPPTNLLLLQEQPFKNLMKIHNQYKQIDLHANSLLSYEEIYKILKLYVEVRSQSYEELKDILRQYVVELIDKAQLNAKQYRLIYHQDLLLPTSQTDFDLSNDRTNTDSFDSMGRSKTSKERIQLIFDPILSENYLLKKESQELRNSNDYLTQELKKSREALEISTRNGSKWVLEAQRIQTQLITFSKQTQERNGILERELVTMQHKLGVMERQICYKDESIQKLSQQLNDAMFSQNEQLNKTVESDYQMNPQNQNVDTSSILDSQIIYESFQPEKQLRQSTLSLFRGSSQKQQIYFLIVLKRRISFDHTPSTVTNSKELECLLEFFSVSIFEKMSFKLIYRGQNGLVLIYLNRSRDGQDSSSMFNKIRYQSDIIVLVRTWEQEKVFGIYISHEITKVDECFTDQRTFLFSVSHQKKMKQLKPISIKCDRNFIQFGRDIKLFQNECSYPIDFEAIDGMQVGGSEYIAGADLFTIEEIEVYKTQVIRSMDI